MDDRTEQVLARPEGRRHGLLAAAFATQVGEDLGRIVGSGGQLELVQHAARERVLERGPLRCAEVVGGDLARCRGALVEEGGGALLADLLAVLVRILHGAGHRPRRPAGQGLAGLDVEFVGLEVATPFTGDVARLVGDVVVDRDVRVGHCRGCRGALVRGDVGQHQAHLLGEGVGPRGVEEAPAAIDRGVGEVVELLGSCAGVGARIRPGDLLGCAGEVEGGVDEILRQGAGDTETDRVRRTVIARTPGCAPWPGRGCRSARRCPGRCAGRSSSNASRRPRGCRNARRSTDWPPCRCSSACRRRGSWCRRRPRPRCRSARCWWARANCPSSRRSSGCGGSARS